MNGTSWGFCSPMAIPTKGKGLILGGISHRGTNFSGLFFGDFPFLSIFGYVGNWYIQQSSNYPVSLVFFCFDVFFSGSTDVVCFLAENPY